MAVQNDEIFDINKYVKHDFSKVKDVIEKLKDPNNITSEYLTELFSNKAVSQNDEGEITVTAPEYRVTDWFDLPAKTLDNQPNAVETTFGSFIFNSLIINNAFHSKISYINDEMNKKNFDKLHTKISELIMENVLTVEEYGVFIDTTLWMGYQTELFMPGVSEALIFPNKTVKEMKIQLLKEHPEFLNPDKLISSDEVAAYHDEIEKPLLDVAEKEMKKDPSYRLFQLKKPSFSNNYKNSLITSGPMLDTRNGQYRINNNSLNDGATGDNFDLLADKAMYASYSRGVNTAKGGTYAKYTNSMMQTVTLDPKGSDCGTKGFINYTITKDNYMSILFNYAISKNGELIMLTDEILKTLIGKTIKMRTPLYCKSKTGICNKCAGEGFYKLGIKNVGLTSNIVANSQLNISMKKFHDLSVKTTPVNPGEFFVFEK